MSTRIIIAGGRDFHDYDFFEKHVSAMPYFSLDDIEIISGGASGVDTMAIRYAREHNLPLKVFPADWNKFGRAAGPIRNEQMAKYASEETNHGVLIAFWNGYSRGTGSMIRLAEQYGLKVEKIII